MMQRRGFWVSVLLAAAIGSLTAILVRIFRTILRD